MKQISFVVCTLILVVSGVQAQANSSEWKRYRVEGEEFSAILPTLPAMSTDQRLIGRRQTPRLERRLGAYANGVAYTVFSYENPPPRESLEQFMRSEFKLDSWEPGGDVMLNGFKGKQHFMKHTREGVRQTIAAKGHIYVFQAAGAPADDPRVKQFFASISLGGKVEGEKVSDGPGILLDPLAQNESALATAKQLRFLPAMKEGKLVSVSMQLEYHFNLY